MNIKDLEKMAKEYQQQKKVNIENAVDKIKEDDHKIAFDKLCKILKWNPKLVFADRNSLFLVVINYKDYSVSIRKIIFKTIENIIDRKSYNSILNYMINNKIMTKPDLFVEFGWFQRDELVSIEDYNIFTNHTVKIDRIAGQIKLKIPIPAPIKPNKEDLLKDVLVDIYGEYLHYLLDVLSIIIFEKKKLEDDKLFIWLNGEKEDFEFTIKLLEAIYPNNTGWAIAAQEKNRLFNKRIVFITKGVYNKFYSFYGKTESYLAFVGTQQRGKRNMGIEIKETGEKKLKFNYDILKSIGNLIKNDLYKRYKAILQFRPHFEHPLGYDVKIREKKLKICDVVRFLEVQKITKISWRDFYTICIRLGSRPAFTRDYLIKIGVIKIGVELDGKYFEMIDTKNINNELLFRYRSS